MNVFISHFDPYVGSNTILEMLRLCPGDNAGQRTWLGSNLIRINRIADALFFAQIWTSPQASEGTILPQGGTVFETPSKQLWSDDVEESLSKFGTTAILYTAALASFKLFGNCPQSCQYLRTAARANPHVLVKILGKKTRPGLSSCLNTTNPQLTHRTAHLNDNPFVPNGPEEARDYLWLTQDLWMETDVWAWVNDNDDIKAVVLKECCSSLCNVQETKATQFKRCSECHLVNPPAP